ncbi:uncharacterized protein LOC117339522 isoform X1 [Pecten maximus]|uniref:uncharacterized protein LOC117339522 isoform X1 n=1 Tax=Pecten maximus TaxID=6579 RepID=UPI00145816F4|nr:uncharacterized protein LOC117339522 isoform X1 [Pecten maximus]
MDASKQSSRVLDRKGYSAVNKFELMCLENQAKDNGPNEERTRLSFQVLDDLIPKLGVYTRIFAKVKDDLFASVYSENLTTDKAGSITQIPYYTQVRRIYDEHDDKLDVVTEQLDIVKQRLFEKHKQLEESQQKGAALEERIEELNQRLVMVDSMLTDKTSEIVRLEEELNEELEKSAQMQARFEGDIEDLRESLEEAHGEIEYLSRYKKGYDDLYNAFLDQPEMDELPKKNHRPVISTRRANLMTNIEAAQRLEEQIMSVMNTAVEEFDKFLEEHKEELQKIEIRDDLTNAEFEVQEMDIEQADQELEAMQERFRNTVGDISNELQLLKQHGTMLMEQLQTLEQNKPTLAKRNRERSKFSDTNVQPGLGKSDSILSVGLHDTEGDEEGDADPFIPQERVFAKYAAMLYTSSNMGKSFDEFKDAKFCPSCGEKTVICPHKLPGVDKVIILPHNTSHIKITRPKVRINKELIDEMMKPRSPELSFDMPSTAMSYSRPRMDSSVMTIQTPATSRESPSLVGSEAHMDGFTGRPQHTMHRLFDDYKDRTHLERSIPRPLSLERTLSQVEQFWAYMIWTDENGDENDLHHSTLDHVYLFMRERYIIEDIMFLCAHDFLSSVAESGVTNKTVQVFGHILAGNLDGAVFRYAMLMSDFIQAVEWKEVEDFRAFASVVYPFLGEDDVETLQMSYTSFSENRISEQLVCQFLMHLILKYREPCFQEMEHKILPFQTQESGQPTLNEKEFKDAIDAIVPLASDKLRNRLFYESEKAVRIDGFQGKVPIMRLSQICGYLYLLQIANVTRENVANKVIQWRERPHSSGSEKKTHELQLVETDEPLITMMSVKNLATNIARRTRIRQERVENQQDLEWYS